MNIPLGLALILNLFYVLFICEFSSAHTAVHVGIFVCFVTFYCTESWCVNELLIRWNHNCKDVLKGVLTINKSKCCEQQ